jgi:N-dimethylarginine dimethylaminohydrolase
MTAKKPLIRAKQATSKPLVKPDPNVKIENPSMWDVPTYLMSPPLTWDTDEPNNTWMQKMSPEEIEEDFDKARSQWLDLYQFVAAEALVYILPPDGDYPDRPYVANVAIVLCHLPKPVVVVANYKSPPRMGEDEGARKFFEMFDYPIERPPFFWEGEAETKHIRDNIYIGGYGIRTDPKVYDWFEKKFDMKVVRCKMTDEKLYHWDCCCAPLTSEDVMVCTSILEKSEVKEIEKVCQIIDVPLRLAHAGITNNVRLVNHVMCGSSVKQMGPKDKDYQVEKDKIVFLEKVCAKQGMEPVMQNISEFEKSGAAVSCLFCHVNRAAYSQPII